MGLLLNKWVWLSAFVVIICLSVFAYGNSRFNDGIAHEKLAQEEVTKEIVRQRVVSTKNKLNEEIARKTRQLEQTKALIIELQNRKPEVIYREIKKVVNVSDCKRLGDDYVRLFNSIHEAE